MESDLIWPARAGASASSLAIASATDGSPIQRRSSLFVIWPPRQTFIMAISPRCEATRNSVSSSLSWAVSALVALNGSMISSRRPPWRAT